MFRNFFHSNALDLEFRGAHPSFLDTPRRGSLREQLTDTTDTLLLPLCRRAVESHTACLEVFKRFDAWLKGGTNKIDLGIDCESIVLFLIKQSQILKIPQTSTSKSKNN